MEKKNKIKIFHKQVENLRGNRYVLVCVDDFSKYFCVHFIKEKSYPFFVFIDLCLQLQREKNLNIVRIQSDHGRKFENRQFAEFCFAKGIHHELFTPITPQQNGVVEWKNRTLQEMARAMLHAHNTLDYFWAEALNTACHIHN